MRDFIIKRLRNSIIKLERVGVKLRKIEKDIIMQAGLLLSEALREISYPNIPGHELEHSFRVFELAIYIWWHERKGDFRKIVFSALFHDIMRGKENHAFHSAEFTREFLKNRNFDDIADDIARIINEHSYSAKLKPSSFESAILQDADKLDALGAIGIARVFAYGGHLKRQLYNPEDPTKGESLGHFFEKILKLPKLMNTETGRKLALKRVKVILEFIRQFFRELNLLE